MAARVTRLSASVTGPRYRIDGAAGWCEVTVGADARRLGSFGGSVWPDAFPGLFELHGPDADAGIGGRGLITGRTSYRLRVGVDLAALAG